MGKKGEFVKGIMLVKNKMVVIIISLSHVFSDDCCTFVSKVGSNTVIYATFAKWETAEDFEFPAPSDCLPNLVCNKSK